MSLQHIAKQIIALSLFSRTSHGRITGRVRVDSIVIRMAAAAVDLVRFGRIAACTTTARGDCYGYGRGDRFAAGTSECQRV